MTVSEHVRVGAGRVVTLTLARPEQRNALNVEMLGALTTALEDATADRGARCLMLGGEGKHFCAGADFGEVAAGAAEGARYGAGFEALLRAIEEHPLPVLAKVQGAALGAGCQLLAACDLAVVASDARIGIPSARIGLLLDLEKIQRLVRAFGVVLVREMLLAGKELSGAEAAARGVVARAVPPGDLEVEAAEAAEAVASAAPLSVRGSKAAIRRVLDHGALEREAHPEAFAEHDQSAIRAITSEDLAEGLAALRERRPPDFRGR